MKLTIHYGIYTHFILFAHIVFIYKPSNNFESHNFYKLLAYNVLYGNKI